MTSQKKYLLGIDGGGTKTEFAIADTSLKVIKTIRINKGSNPWGVGLAATLAVLDEGLKQLEEYKPHTVQAVAGISGCFVPNKFTEAIEQRLTTFCPNSRVVGDLPISFRAGTDQPTGIIAIAGTGSSVVHFFSEGSPYVYDGVSVGGRDLGYWIAQAYLRGTLQGKAGRAFVAKTAPVLGEGSLRTTADFYHSNQLNQLAKHISELSATSPEFKDLQIWIDVAADRWAYKLYGIVTKFINKEQLSSVPLVLSGSLWKLAYVREHVIHSLEKEFPEVHVLWDPKVRPVVGALRLAQDANIIH